MPVSAPALNLARPVLAVVDDRARGRAGAIAAQRALT
jgi:hypothetical protein